MTIGHTLQRPECSHKGRQEYWFFIHYLARNQEPPAVVKGVAEDERSLAAKKRRLEAVLFLSPEGVKSRKLAKLAGLADATEARTLIRELNKELDKEGRSFRIEEIAGGYTLMTRSNFAPWLRRLAHIPGELRFSQSALETLAIVAYRQPVMRANVEAIRGVGCSEVLKQLMEMELVRISGRSEDLGRPYLYGTTRRFLQIFGLRSADRLPRIDWVNEPQLSLSSTEVDRDSETKESTVNMSFSATATLQDPSELDEEAQRDESTVIVSSIDDDDDVDFDDDDDDEWDDDDEDDEIDDEDDEEDSEDDPDGGWVEVDDDDDWDDDDDDDDDDEKDDDDDDWGDDDDEDDDWD